MSASMRKLRLKVEVKREGGQGAQDGSGETMLRRGNLLFGLLARPAAGGPAWAPQERRELRRQTAATLRQKAAPDWRGDLAQAGQGRKASSRRPLSPEARRRRLQEALGITFEPSQP
jgi:hypothetical protein